MLLHVGYVKLQSAKLLRLKQAFQQRLALL